MLISVLQLGFLGVVDCVLVWGARAWFDCYVSWRLGCTSVGLYLVVVFCCRLWVCCGLVVAVFV